GAAWHSRSLHPRGRAALTDANDVCADAQPGYPLGGGRAGPADLAPRPGAAARRPALARPRPGGGGGRAAHPTTLAAGHRIRAGVASVARTPVSRWTAVGSAAAGRPDLLCGVGAGTGAPLACRIPGAVICPRFHRLEALGLCDPAAAQAAL